MPDACLCVQLLAGCVPVLVIDDIHSCIATSYTTYTAWQRGSVAVHASWCTMAHDSYVAGLICIYARIHSIYLPTTTYYYYLEVLMHIYYLLLPRY